MDFKTQLQDEVILFFGFIDTKCCKKVGTDRVTSNPTDSSAALIDEAAERQTTDAEQKLKSDLDSSRSIANVGEDSSSLSLVRCCKCGRNVSSHWVRLIVVSVTHIRTCWHFSACPPTF